MSENTTPERILLQADFSTTRHEQWEPDDGSREHEAERQEKLSRERMLLLADMTADFRDDPFSAGGAPPERPVSGEETNG